MQMDSFVYTGPAAFSAKKLQKVLPQGAKYHISIEKNEEVHGILRDTATDALLQEAMLLFQQKESLLLIDLRSGEVVEQALSGDFRFPEDLDDGPVSNRLKMVTKLRAFLRVAKVHFRLNLGVLLDDEEKTRARFRNIYVKSAAGTFLVGATVSMRGYQRAHEDLVEGLGKVGVLGVTDLEGLYIALGVKETIYKSKPVLNIESDDPAGETATEIIKTFITVARANEVGVVADYDTEFLHDYRVSFRKVRSVLSLFKGVYQRDETIRLKVEFAEVMRQTNRLRDLDVYLLERENYFELVPEPSHDGLTALFDYLEKERRKEHKKVVKILQSKKYKKKQIALAASFQTKKEMKPGPKGKASSKVFASKLILKRYGQVCRIARTIDKTTEDAVVHDLRISCKKLRYLMEFFTPLFHVDSITLLIKSLKVLQDNLGKFNDYSVQQGFLRQIMAGGLGAFTDKELQVTESVGALTAMLYRSQKKEKKQVMKNFAAFDNVETRALFKELFKGGGAG
jgi:CHAD domain-containing protein